MRDRAGECCGRFKIVVQYYTGYDYRIFRYTKVLEYPLGATFQKRGTA